ETKDLDDALTAALGMVVETIHAQTGTFWFYERSGDGRIHPRAVYGGADMSDICLLPGEGIAGQVIEDGQSVIITDCQADPRWAGRVDEKTGFRTDSMICVPLSMEEGTFGSIQIINKTDRILFDEKDLWFTECLAEEVARVLAEKGFLAEGGWTESAEITADKITFRELFCEGTEKDMLDCLEMFDEIDELPDRKRREAIRLCRQLRVVLSSRRR
ncbi:MAG: GAF domain-containing protein, partial [Clostridiales bacterium]|nr:GAF domain-containing protein [Clostridiales bacterium]